MPSAKLILGLTAIATTLMVPGLGHAQTCTSDADCAKGLSCQANPIVTPAVAICYDGDGGGVCKPVDNPPPVATSSCQAATCVTSADCGPTMVCNSQTTTSCTGGTPVSVKCDPTTTACDAGVVPDPVPVSCTDTTISKCMYKYELPCNADTDCGDNFTCQPTTSGMCSGSTGVATGGTGTASAGVDGGSDTGGVPTPLPSDVDAGTATPVTCTTVTSYPGSCQAKPVSCTVDADCPATWTCVTGASTGTAVSSGPATAGSAPMAIDAGVPVVVPPPVTTTTSACQPPSTHGTYTSGSTLGTDIAKTGTADAGAAQGSTTPPSPIVPAGNGSGTGQTAAATTDGGGCSVGGEASGAGWVLSVLGLLGLALARRRRV